MFEGIKNNANKILGAAGLATVIAVGGVALKERNQNIAGAEMHEAFKNPDVVKRTVSNIEGELNRPVRAGGKLVQDSDKHLVFKEEGVAESDWSKASAEYNLTAAAKKFNYSFNGIKVALDKPLTSMSERTLDLGIAVSALDKTVGDAGSQKLIKSVFQVEVPSKTLLSASKGDKLALGKISELVYQKIGVTSDMTSQDEQTLQAQLQSVIKERIATETVK